MPGSLHLASERKTCVTGTVPFYLAPVCALNNSYSAHRPIAHIQALWGSKLCNFKTMTSWTKMSSGHAGILSLQIRTEIKALHNENNSIHRSTDGRIWRFSHEGLTNRSKAFWHFTKSRGGVITNECSQILLSHKEGLTMKSDKVFWMAQQIKMVCQRRCPNISFVSLMWEFWFRLYFLNTDYISRQSARTRHYASVSVHPYATGRGE